MLFAIQYRFLFYNIKTIQNGIIFEKISDLSQEKEMEQLDENLQQKILEWQSSLARNFEELQHAATDLFDVMNELKKILSIFQNYLSHIPLSKLSNLIQNPKYRDAKEIFDKELRKNPIRLSASQNFILYWKQKFQNVQELTSKRKKINVKEFLETLKYHDSSTRKRKDSEDSEPIQKKNNQSIREFPWKSICIIAFFIVVFLILCTYFLSKNKDSHPKAIFI